MHDIKSQVLGLRSIAMAGSEALLERPRNLSSPLDQLLLKRHLQTHRQSIQPDPQPSQSKGVRIEKLLQLFHVYPPLIALHPIDCGRADSRMGEEGWEGAALAISHPQTLATGGEDNVISPPPIPESVRQCQEVGRTQWWGLSRKYPPQGSSWRTPLPQPIQRQ